VFTAFYVSGSREGGTGVLRILIFSEKQLNSSSIGYYVLSFHGGKSSSSIAAFAIPIVFTLVLTLFNVLTLRVLAKARSGRNALSL